MTGFFLTPPSEKTKTQGKNSTSGGHFPPFKRNSRKNLNFTYITLEKISWCTTFYAIFNKYFQNSTNLRNFLQKILLPPFHEKTCTRKNPAISRVFVKERKKCYKSKNLVLLIISKFSSINLP